MVSGPCWTPLQAVSLVATRGVRDLEKMSRCRRNVKVGKLRVLQAEAALLMQRCGSRLQAAHSDATSHARHAVVA